MNQYFEDVVSSLTYDDINVLSILYDNEATASFKSIKNKEVLERTGYTEAVYRRILYKLTGNKFISTIQINKQQGLYITQYGIQAINKSLQEVSAG